MNLAPVILASASPRRKVIFRYLGVPYKVYSEEVDESVLPGESPDSYVLRLACLKAEQIRGKINSNVVVGADTVVEIDGKILGKPDTAPEATEMLNLLNGRMHRVLTGVAVLASLSPECRTGLEISSVWFKRIADTRIQEYVETGEPFGKAGAYAIQGKGLTLIAEWQGSYSNIVGLPLRLTQDLLWAAGYQPRFRME
jgi:septum formation protein